MQYINNRLISESSDNEIRFTFIDNPKNDLLELSETNLSYQLDINDAIIESKDSADAVEHAGYFLIDKKPVLSMLKYIIRNNRYFYDYDIPYHDKIYTELLGLSGDIDFTYKGELGNLIKPQLKGILIEFKVYGKDSKGKEVDIDIDWKNAPKYSNFMSNSISFNAHTNIITIPVDKIVFVPSDELKQRFKELFA